MYGSSQARDRIGATAASLHHSHSNLGSELHLQHIPQLTATHGARPGIEPASSWIQLNLFVLRHHGTLVFINVKIEKKIKIRSSRHGTVETNPTRNYEIVGLIPDLEISGSRIQGCHELLV